MKHIKYCTLSFLLLGFMSLTGQDCIRELDLCTKDSEQEFQIIASHCMALIEKGEVDELLGFWDPDKILSSANRQKLTKDLESFQAKFFKNEPGVPGLMPIETDELTYERIFFTCDETKSDHYAQIRLIGREKDGEYHISEITMNEGDAVESRDEEINYLRSDNNPPPPPPPFGDAPLNSPPPPPSAFGNRPPPPPPPPFGGAPSSNIVLNEHIKFELDSSKWYIQKPEDFIAFLTSIDAQPEETEENIVGLFTYNKTPILNYPSIMILNTRTFMDPPPMDELEKELGAMSLTLDDVEDAYKTELDDNVESFKFDKPVLIKEKQLVMLESTADLGNNQILKIRQSMFFKKKNLIVVQISYIENRDEKHLADYNRVVETIKFE